jgi:hypothetical protein
MEEARANCPRGSALTGPGCPTRNAWPAPRPPCFTRFPFCDLFVPGRPVRKLAHSHLHPADPAPGVIGGVVASTLMDMPNDVYFQIGLLTILGLTTKNAILIVQFARARVDEGMTI